MRCTLPLLLLAILASADAATAQINVALSPFPVLQQPAGYRTFEDGSGGVWAVFQGAQVGSALYAQHVLADGTYASGFSAAARIVANSGTLVNNMSAAPDGMGGAIVQWFGVNPFDSTSQFVALRCQHLDAVGRSQYPDSGIVVSSASTSALVLGDGQGGAYVVWEELKGASNPDIIAQHYSGAGSPLWAPVDSPTGVNICAVVGLQRLRALVDDGAGGAFAVWADSRLATTVPLYVMRLTPTGPAALPWTTNGVCVTPVTTGIRIVGSGPAAGHGLWLAWRDLAIGNELRVQHVAGNGSMVGPLNGAVATSVTPARADLVQTPTGGVFATWMGTDIRCSRLDSTCTRLWPETDGRVLAAPTATVLDVRAATDGAGGQRVAWSWDNAGQSDVNILEVDGTGAPLAGWPALGQSFAATILPESPVAWLRPDTPTPGMTWLAGGVLNARLPSGALGVGPSIGSALVSLSPPFPNPLRGRTLSLRFSAPAGPARLDLFDAAGRRVLTRALYSNGGSQAVPLEDAARLAPGVYSLRLTAMGRSATQRLVRVD